MLELVRRIFSKWFYDKEQKKEPFFEYYDITNEGIIPDEIINEVNEDKS